MRKLLVLAAAVVGLAAFGSNAFADVTTDKFDYNYGETVHISGDGMNPGEDVRVQVLFPDGSVAQSSMVVADDNGEFASTFLLAEGMPAGLYEVIATGLSSLNTYTTVFDPASSSCMNGKTPTGSGATQTSLTVNWLDTCNNENRFIIHYGTVSGSLGSAVTAPAAAGDNSNQSKEITGLTCGTTYFFTVEAQKDAPGAQTSTSNEGSAATAACTPTDTTPPVVTCGADIDDVEATGPTGAVVNWAANKCTATDDTDGTIPCDYSPASGSTFPLGTTTVTCTATDSSDNEGSDTFDVTVVDTTAPDVDCDAPDTTPWYNTDVEVPCTATDTASPPAVPASFTLATTGEGSSLSTDDQEVCDSAAPPNCVTAGPYGPYKVDKTAPTVDCTVPDQTIWYAGNVSVPCTASDALSGLDDLADAAFNLMTSVAAGSETASASTGSRDVYDVAGNLTAAGPYTFKVDRKGPTLTCESPAPTFLLNQAGAMVSATVTDGGSGPLASPVSAAADTSTVGAHSVSVTGYDNVGNSTTVNCSYNVVFVFVGFLQPVENPNMWNSAKAGQTIPLKWQLKDASGNYVSDLGSFTSLKYSRIQCPSGNVPVEDIGDAAAQGSTVLRYDPTDQQFIYNWATNKAWKGYCYKAVLTLSDASTHEAYFQFK